MSESVNKGLEPEGRFVEFLEWQLLSEHRRASRLRPRAGRVAIPRWAAAAALAFGFLTTGVTVIKASEYIQDSWRKKIEVARAEADVRLSEVRLAAVQAETARTKELHAVGAIPVEEARRAELDAATAELVARRARVSRDEVEATGQAPRDELFAPTAAGRDFVSERLEIERQAAGLALEEIQARLTRVETMFRAGLVSEEEVRSLRAEVAARQAVIGEVQERLELRRRFLAKEATALEVEVAGRLADADQRLKAASARVEELQERLARLAVRAGAGLIPPGEVRAAEAELESAKAVMKLASVERAELAKVR